MSWIQKLYETYELCANAPQFERNPLNPVSSQYQDTQIQITIDGEGRFLRAEASEIQDTLIPVTEASASRSGNNPEPNPLADKLCYCASDLDKYGGDTKRFAGYQAQLLKWCSSPHADPKVSAVLEYLGKGTLASDLIAGRVLQYSEGKLSRLKVRPGKTIDPEDAWIRWRVEMPGIAVANTWEDTGLLQRWTSFENSGEQKTGICAVTGKILRIARIHPRGIRANSDRAKLISSNDKAGFTYRGRFTEADQAVAVGYEVTQKAHNALRWLIKRQGARVASQVYVAWSVDGAEVPDPQKSTSDWLGLGDDPNVDDTYSGDAGQLLALRLRSKVKGYRASLGDASGVIVMGLDTAAKDTGRLAVTYYRELTGSEFLGRVEQWHAETAWLQAVPDEKARSRHDGKRYRYIAGAPSPVLIAEGAYGSKVEGEDGKKLLRATVERLLPCIVDGRPLPRDVVEASIRRACKAGGLKKTDKWEWEKCLGIACALVRGSSKEEEYQMALEENRTTRDYLFGRLLAIADNIEHWALYLAKEQRDTNAAKLMQRFADHPCSTWRSIELALTPYKTRLRTNRPAVLRKRDELLDTVMGMFTQAEDFTSDSKLSGEFLLGFHCQRAALWTKKQPDGGPDDKEDESSNQGDTE